MKAPKPMRHYFWKKLKSTRAVTYTEAIVSLFILSLVVVVLFRVGMVLIPSLMDDRREIINHRKELILRKSFSKAFKQINPPWWYSDYEYTFGQNIWAFPFYGGVEDSELVFQLNDEILSVEIEGERLFTFSPVEEINFSVLHDQFDSPFLVEISIDGFMGGELIFPLGSRVVSGREVP